MLTFFRIMLTGITPAIVSLQHGKGKELRQYRACSTGSHLRDPPQIILTVILSPKQHLY